MNRLAYLQTWLAANHTEEELDKLAKQEGVSLSAARKALRTLQYDCTAIEEVLGNFFALDEDQSRAPLCNTEISQHIAGRTDANPVTVISRATRLARNAGRNVESTLWAAPGRFGGDVWWFSKDADKKLWRETYRKARCLSSQVGQPINAETYSQALEVTLDGRAGKVARAAINANARHWEADRPSIMVTVLGTLFLFTGEIEVHDLRGAVIRLAKLRNYANPGTHRLLSSLTDEQLGKWAARQGNVKFENGRVTMHLANRLQQIPADRHDKKIHLVARFLARQPGRSLSRSSIYDWCSDNEVETTSIKPALVQHFLFDIDEQDTVRVRGRS